MAMKKQDSINKSVDAKRTQYGSQLVTKKKDLKSHLCKFDPKFEDSTYLMTGHARSRLKGYLRTFAYMITCGLVLVIGGGAFFIHESVAMKNHKHSNSWEGKVTHQRSSEGSSNTSSTKNVNRTAPKDYEAIFTASYAKELKIVGFIFLGVGTLFVLIGSPLAYQFWKRYQRAKEIERCPMLNQKYQDQLNKDYYGSPQRAGLIDKQSEDTDEAKPSEYINSPIKAKPKKCFWDFRRQRSVNEDSFRIAAHHHPSFNLVPIESLATLGREVTDQCSDTESEEEKQLSVESNTPVEKTDSSKRGSIFQCLFSPDNSNDVTVYDVTNSGVDNDRVDLLDEQSVNLDENNEAEASSSQASSPLVSEDSGH
ncbi:uncharacterized protein LOC100183878 isoform X2 [Ciona intestinalis]